MSKSGTQAARPSRRTGRRTPRPRDSEPGRPRANIAPQRHPAREPREAASPPARPSNSAKTPPPPDGGTPDPVHRLLCRPLLLEPRRRGARRARVFGNRSGTESCCTSNTAFATLRTPKQDAARKRKTDVTKKYGPHPPRPRLLTDRTEYAELSALACGNEEAVAIRVRLPLRKREQRRATPETRGKPRTLQGQIGIGKTRGNRSASKRTSAIWTRSAHLHAGQRQS